MIINTNMASLNTVRQLGVNEKATQGSLAKLSSGLKINTAADDAAGLAISEKMRGQISGLNTASSNAQNGISLVSTAEGALNETTAILQRMRELAVSAGNDTNTAADRTAMQTETNALLSAVNDIGTNTQFNTKNLLDGSMGKAVTTAAANISTSSVIGGAAAQAVVGDTLVALKDASGNSLGITATDKVTISYAKNGTTTTNSFTAGALTVAALGTTDGATASADYGITVVAGQFLATASGTGTTNAVNGLTVTVTDSTGATRTAASNALSSFSETTAAADVRTNGTATLQIGANSNQSMSIDINNMGSASLGVAGVQLSTQSQANVAVKLIDTATAKVSAERSKLGAFQNRLEHTINNLSTSSQNITTAEANVRDVDMAKEMTNFQKNNILQQAAQSMLAQANQQGQGVLKLLQ